RAVGGLHRVVCRDHATPRVLEPATPDLVEQLLEADAQETGQHRASETAALDVAHVDLVRRGCRRITRVADALHTLLEMDACELDFTRDVGLGLRQLDLAGL